MRQPSERARPAPRDAPWSWLSIARVTMAISRLSIPLRIQNINLNEVWVFGIGNCLIDTQSIVRRAGPAQFRVSRPRTHAFAARFAQLHADGALDADADGR